MKSRLFSRAKRAHQHAKSNSMKTKRIAAAIVSLIFFSLIWSIRAADVISVWGGARGTIVLKSDGTVWTCGGNAFGKLGINTTTPGHSSQSRFMEQGTSTTCTPLQPLWVAKP